MTKAEMDALQEKIFDEVRAVRGAGHAEYAHVEADTFANFARAGADLGIPREQVLWIFAMKHRDGIASYLKGHQSQREDVRGRIKDLIAYLVLLWGMIEERDEPMPKAPLPSGIYSADCTCGWRGACYACR